MARVVHPIEKQSYEILRARVDTSGLPQWTRAVVERVIHASADITYLPISSATKRTSPPPPRRCATARRSSLTRR